MKVALVGCGSIAERYAECIRAYEPLTLAGVTDTIPERAAALAAAFDVRQYESLAGLLADESVDLVVNLTVPEAHAPVTAAALEAGKHVHSEKPIALGHDEALELVELARRVDRRLSASPATLLGEAQQTAWKLVRDGAVGDVRVVYADANWGRDRVVAPLTPGSLCRRPARGRRRLPADDPDRDVRASSPSLGVRDDARAGAGDSLG